MIGNVGAIGQDSLKRMLAWSGVAQAGYMLAGVVVASELGVKSVVFYLFVYLFMNVAAFAVVIARERETALGDDIEAVAGHRRVAPAARLAADDQHARRSPACPAPPASSGKFFLIEATVEGDFTGSASRS